MRHVVSDTGPLLHLSEANALPLLNWTGQVSIPRAVDVEMAQQDSLWQTQKPAWLYVEVLTTSYETQALSWRQAGLLESGEAEAVALARQINADWLLTDDAAARLFAQSLGIEVHGSLGVVLWAAAAGHCNRADAEGTLERLARSSLWISAGIIAEVKAALTKLFA